MKRSAMTIAILLLATSPFATAQSNALADACKVLSDAEVRRVFPDAKSGTRDASLEKYGITSCQWAGRGRFSLTLAAGDIGTIDEEIDTIAQGFVDPLKPGSIRNLRIIKFAGIGDAAMGFIETTDASKGILTTAAVVVVQRGKKQVTMFSSELANRDRATAQESLADLARAASKRM